MRSDVAAVVALVASVAHAEPSGDEARNLFEAAEAAFNAGRFDDALTVFSLAYKADPKPGFLFNIGQCHRKLAHHAEAREAFEQYLEKLPQAPNRAAVLELIAEEGAAAAPPTPTAPATPTTPTAPTASTTPTTPPPTTPTTPTTSSTDANENTWVMPVVAVSAGVVVVAAVVLVFVASPPPGTNLGVIDLRRRS